ncbi:MAG: ankyrin repeat domain-containing protein [Verrucomicrobiota bacterium]
MKNQSVGQKPAGKKWRAIFLALLSLALLAGLVATMLRASDHRVELRSALMARDHARLEKLLRDHPGLVDVELPNRSAKDTWSPLHLAACLGDPETIQILTAHKARVNARDSNGLTPLHYTVAQHRYENAEMLINKSADLNAKGRDGHTPLDLAKNLRDQRLIEMFRIRGAKE